MSLDQTEFLQLSDVAKWREYRDATELLARVRKQLFAADTILDEIVNIMGDDGIEVYCDVNPEDCDHCNIKLMVEGLREDRA